MKLSQLERDNINRRLERRYEDISIFPSSIMVCPHPAESQTIPLVSFVARSEGQNDLKLHLSLCPAYDPHWEAIEALYHIAREQRKAREEEK